MKDSGIEWIGKIPADWNVTKIKYLFSSGKGLSITKADLEDNGLPVISYGQIHSKENTNTDIKDCLIRFVDNKYEVFKQCKVNQYDFVFADTSEDYDGCGNCCYKRDNSTLYAGYHSIVLHSFKERDNRFLAYLFKTDSWRKQLRETASGVKVFSITQKKLINTAVILPPENQRIIIANFLDHKCSEIDALTADIQTQIETLEEYKKSVITEAVTKGLDPNVEMQDSGVEWIGKIPADWNVTKIKYLFSSGKGLSITKADLEDNGLPVISYGQIHSKENTNTDIKDCLIRFVDNKYEVFKQCKVNQYDFVFADTSEDYDGCGNCCYKRDNSTLYAGYHSIVLHSFKERDNRFLAYLFKTDSWRKQLRETASGVKVFSITQKKLINTAVILPPENQRIIIANFLDQKCSEIDQTISEKQQQIETLAEYKKSLIYEYVTGKKEVA